jgi:hypothetical protein
MKNLDKTFLSIYSKRQKAEDRRQKWSVFHSTANCYKYLANT